VESIGERCFLGRPFRWLRCPVVMMIPSRGGADDFSILITHVDHHLHNHGFLDEERGLGRLAPAYDFNPFPD
jgi:hypothetical protein